MKIRKIKRKGEWYLNANDLEASFQETLDKMKSKLETEKLLLELRTKWLVEESLGKKKIGDFDETMKRILKVPPEKGGE